MSVYFKSNEVKDIKKYLANPNIPAHKKIGSAFHHIVTADNKTGSLERNGGPLGLMGVRSADIGALQKLTMLIIELKQKKNLFFEAAEDVNGLFFIKEPTGPSNESRTVAVFKLGRKRTAVEMLARRIAHILKLEEHAVPGVFCAVENPPFNFENEQIVEELFSGKEKIFAPPHGFSEEDEDVSLSDLEDFSNDEIATESSEESGSEEEVSVVEFSDDSSYEDLSSAEETARYVVGIVEPFLTPREHRPNRLQFAKMTMVALVLGLRDAKTDGYINGTLIDNDDCMPVRNDPSLEDADESVSATQLLYLDQDPQAKKVLSHDQIKELYEIVSKWQATKLVSELKKVTIQFEDRRAENMVHGAEAVDEGGYAIKVENPAQPHPVNGVLNLFTKKKQVVSDRQIDACLERMGRIKTFVTKCHKQQQQFSTYNLAMQVDLHAGKVHYLLSNSGGIPQEYVRFMASPIQLSSNVSPSKLNTSVREFSQGRSSAELSSGEHSESEFYSHFVPRNLSSSSRIPIPTSDGTLESPLPKRKGDSFLNS